MKKKIVNAGRFILATGEVKDKHRKSKDGAKVEASESRFDPAALYSAAEKRDSVIEVQSLLRKVWIEPVINASRNTLASRIPCSNDHRKWPSKIW